MKSGVLYLYKVSAKTLQTISVKFSHIGELQMEISQKTKMMIKFYVYLIFTSVHEHCYLKC